jgi:hypothetical protein
MTIVAKRVYQSNEWEKAERDHKRLNPSAGDYWWEEMFCPVLVVLAVSGGFVTVCRETKDAGDNKWTWDLTKPSIIDRKQFAERLEDARVGGSHFWAVKEFEGKPKASAVLSERNEGTDK